MSCNPRNICGLLSGFISLNFNIALLVSVFLFLNSLEIRVREGSMVLNESMDCNVTIVPDASCVNPNQFVASQFPPVGTRVRLISTFSKPEQS